jgi:MFS family permease
MRSSHGRSVETRWLLANGPGRLVGCATSCPACPAPAGSCSRAGPLSAVANGLTYPFLVVYLHRVRELPLGLAGMAAATIAVAAIAVNLAAGPLVDRLGPRRVMAGMLLLGASTVTSRRVSVPTGSSASTS